MCAKIWWQCQLWNVHVTRVNCASVWNTWWLILLGCDSIEFGCFLHKWNRSSSSCYGAFGTYFIVFPSGGFLHGSAISSLDPCSLWKCVIVQQHQFPVNFFNLPAPHILLGTFSPIFNVTTFIIFHILHLHKTTTFSRTLCISYRRHSSRSHSCSILYLQCFLSIFCYCNVQIVLTLSNSYLPPFAVSTELPFLLRLSSVLVPRI